ncbi:DUF6319 family protein [Pseudonocardia kunmingensis]|uniref:Cell wall anchor protein n=1 Tax=Pseudonocardia kunmingensis TaxID=630975 RepID=A0A543DJY1_9PSEU|nr:DUF6319 family protein [Pseudonocardia kunmingensis]TQM09644.1 hypothetical protein FB558_5410 [Pseudonocardia kunmingensis]
MAAPDPLSEQDLAAARAELAAGTPVTVWFTPAAVGVPAGGSAKLVAIDDAAEGDFLQVRPAGSRDTMFCSPGELTRTRPPRKRARAGADKGPEQAKRPAPANRAEPSAPPSPARKAEQASRAEPAPAARAEPDRRTTRASAASTAASTAAPSATSAAGERPPERPRAGRTPRPAEVTVTLNASPDGEWTVEVMTGKKRTVRATPVQAGDVAKAARALPSEVAEAIESSLEAARLRQLERVERLRAELDAAQRALQELSG